MYFAYGAITLWGTASQQFLLYRRLITLIVQVRSLYLTTPRFENLGLGFSLFARRYSGYKLFLSFPPGTEMFHFPGFALTNVTK